MLDFIRALPSPVFFIINGFVAWVVVSSICNTPDLIAWHKLRQQIDPFHLLSRRRKLKVAFCYLIALLFGWSTADRWAHAFHDPFWRIRYWWRRLWIRKDEFHSSLDMDIVLMHNMPKEMKEKYLDDLMRRRQIAHERDCERQCQ